MLKDTSSNLKARYGAIYGALKTKNRFLKKL